MKKILFLAIAVATLFASCQKESFVEPTIEASSDFIASFAETRTSLDGTAVVWSEDDLLTIFTKTSHNRKYQVKELSEDGRTATFGYVSFTGSNDVKITSNYALYPYDADATLTGGVVTTTLQSTQTYNAANGNLGYALMAAQSATNNFSFRNAGSLLRFKVSKIVPDEFTLNSIKVASASNNIAGEATINLNSAEAKAIVTSNGVKEITLADINYDVTTDVKEFYVAMPSMSFADKDLTVTFVFEEGKKVFELPAFDLEQGKIKSITYAINDAEDFTGGTPDSGEIVPIAKPAANEIWYTTTDGEMAEIKEHIYDHYPYTQFYDEEKEVYIIRFEDSVAHLYSEGIFSHSQSNVKTITLPNSITYLPSYAFGFLDRLTNITIPDGVEKIDYSAFYKCSSLTEITIPNSVTTIGENAFVDCSSLANVVLGNSVKTIGKDAFYNCASGMNINIPASVENLPKGTGNYNYSICNNRANVRFESSTPPATLTRHTFEPYSTFYVPAGSKAAYREILISEGEPKIIEY